MAVAVARRWQLRAWVVLVVKRSAYRRPTYRLGARSKLVVEALIFGMARFTAHRTGWSRVLGRVLVDLGIVCVSREKSCGGRSASTVTLVNVRPVLLLLFHKKLRESAHDRVRQTRGRIRYHLPLRERAPHCESDRFIPKRGKQAQVEIVHSGR